MLLRLLTQTLAGELVLIIEFNEKPIGVLELYANHPNENVCYIGLLLIDEKLFGNGLGTKCYLLAEDYIRRALGCGKIKLGISDENDASRFWQKVGFKSNGNIYQWKGEKKTALVREFDKNIER